MTHPQDKPGQVLTRSEIEDLLEIAESAEAGESWNPIEISEFRALCDMALAHLESKLAEAPKEKT